MTTLHDRITANLPARDMDRTVAFYGALGFAVMFRDDAWMVLRRGDLEVEFFAHPQLDPAHSWFSACVRVADGPGLYRAWQQVGLPSQGIPRLQAPQSIGHGLTMFALVDLDGSLLRCLSPGAAWAPIQAAS